ncbi:hypothetical protein ACN23B_25495 [Anabaena sp. FACHB-709]|uniref:Uncharacterized protein n=1 Tax=Anabaena cylindrica FACHB-318 TaxID=2692880 RepID=A0ABR7ZJF7_ANACY|nr:MULTISPECIES: hypothetical protein [Nostocaceae]MBD2172649.1 hypothetical protein [Anabaena cylindrica FACHB-318]MBD2264381.1 hypothetical protein [Anabaena sp. FACHB-709]MBD2274152.1 hypothetical protein [Nostoc sp. PCC 7120 = FACHB-418]MBD2351178.1 hypothetical protein [Trichormus variabilis FACHB-171]
MLNIYFLIPSIIEIKVNTQGKTVTTKYVARRSPSQHKFSCNCDLVTS